VSTIGYQIAAPTCRQHHVAGRTDELSRLIRKVSTAGQAQVSTASADVAGSIDRECTGIGELERATGRRGTERERGTRIVNEYINECMGNERTIRCGQQV